VRKDESTGSKTLEAKKPNDPSKERIWHFVSRGSGKTMMDGTTKHSLNAHLNLYPGVLLQDITPRTIMTLELLGATCLRQSALFVPAFSPSDQRRNPKRLGKMPMRVRQKNPILYLYLQYNNKSTQQHQEQCSALV
jgi:hypothetical protein